MFNIDYHKTIAPKKFYNSSCIILRIFLISSLLLSTLSYAASDYSTKALHWHNLNYIEQSFYEIALYNEYNSKKSRLRKWTKSLNVYIDHQVSDNELHLKILRMHLQQLHEITRLPIKYTTTKSQANLIIYLTRSNKVNQIIRTEINPKAVKQLRNAVCLANIQRNNKNEIIKGLVVIPVDRARMHGKLISCFVEELSQVLGLPNDSKSIYPTIFSDRNIYKLLTGLDYLLLKLLYSPEVKVGMSQSALSPIIRKKLNIWQKNGIIKQAQQEVVKGDLYHLLGYR